MAQLVVPQEWHEMCKEFDAAQKVWLAARSRNEKRAASKVYAEIVDRMHAFGKKWQRENGVEV